MVQGKKQLNGKPKFAEVVIGDNEAKEMRESANARNRRNPYLKLSYPNGVTLILPADISIEHGVERIYRLRVLSSSFHG